MLFLSGNMPKVALHIIMVVFWGLYWQNLLESASGTGVLFMQLTTQENTCRQAGMHSAITQACILPKKCLKKIL